MTVIDPDYLPFTREQLKEHFVAVNRGDKERNLAYYQKSADLAEAFRLSPPSGTTSEIAHSRSLAHQMQRDERFWIAAGLMKIFDSPDRIPQLCSLLSRCQGLTLPIDGIETWTKALGKRQFLYFEVNLPSPTSYKEWLCEHLDERVPIPWLRDLARATHEQELEGATKADAMVISPDTGFAVVFEAKVLSDASYQIRYDVLRNQIARNIDVILEGPSRTEDLKARNPNRTCFVLVTPQLFKAHPEGRLYARLMNEYLHDTRALQRDLPNRKAQKLDFDALRKRLGWLTWEQFNEVLPDACPWLTPKPLTPKTRLAIGTNADWSDPRDLEPLLDGAVRPEEEQGQV